MKWLSAFLVIVISFAILGLVNYDSDGDGVKDMFSVEAYLEHLSDKVEPFPSFPEWNVPSLSDYPDSNSIISAVGHFFNWIKDIIIFLYDVLKWSINVLVWFFQLITALFLSLVGA